MLRVDSPRFQAALRQVEDSIDEAWRVLRDEVGAAAGTPDETDLAETVLQDPTEFEWRVVDGAMQRLTCADCAQPLGAGPVGCAKCDLANGFRFAAREVDRPNVAPGNEHAIRVAAAVARTRHRYTARERCGFELFLPDLLTGQLPTTPEAQRTRALLNELADDELERLVTPADLDSRFGQRR